MESNKGLVNITIPKNLKNKPFRFMVGDTTVTLLSDSRGMSKAFILADKDLPVTTKKVRYERQPCGRNYVKEIEE